MNRLSLALVALAAVLAAAASGAVGTGTAEAKSSAIVNVQLLALSEIHGAVAPPAGSAGRIGAVEAGGFEYLATHLKQLEATNPNSITVATGDNIGASPLVSALFHDEPTIDGLSQMGVDYSNVGNHEFDEGVDELRRMQNGGCHPKDGCQYVNPFTGAKFKYLSANVEVEVTEAQKAAFQRALAAYNKARAAYNRALAAYKKKLAAKRAACKKNKRSAACKRKVRPPARFARKRPAAPTPQPLFPPYAVHTVGGVKVGFIGLTLEATPTIVVPTAVAGLKFLPEVATANRYAAELVRQGVRAIVVLIHQGDGSGPDINSCGPPGQLASLVQQFSSDIDVVASGHSGGSYICTIANKLVTQASSNGRLISKIDLSIDTANGEVTAKSGTNVIVTRTVTKDAAQTAILNRATTASAPLANRVIGSITANITRTENTAGESALGDVIADSQLEATKDPAKGGAVVAFMNPGGIRTDLNHGQISGGEQPGQVTYAEAFAVQPFGNTLTVKTCTGDQIKRLLEQQFDNPAAGQRRVLQVSAGFTYSYNQSAPAGSRVDASSIKIGGTTVVATQQYRVTMNSFLADGGDNFTVFRDCTNPLGGEVDLDALSAYFATRSPVAPGPQNRITRTG